MLPSVGITKADGQTGVVRPSDVGVLAIIAPSGAGSFNVPAAYLRPDIALTDLGGGPLVESASYILPVSGKPVVLVRSTTATAAANGAVTTVAFGTSVPTATGTPTDDFSVKLTIVAGGTVGTTGITYTYSLDGGLTQSAVQSLGTATSITIADAGVVIALAAGTLLANGTASFSTTGAISTDADLPASLEALRVTSQPFECVLFHGIAGSGTISLIDTWLKALAVTGRFKLAVVTCRARAATGETEAQYKTAMQAIFAAAASTDIVVCADRGDVISSIPGRATSGVTQARPVGWAVAARLMRIPIGSDAAYVNDQQVSQFAIVDSRANPKYHDEYMYPGLDDLRLTTLRTFDGKQGSYITNANLFSASGSDYVYAQHARCINRACEIAYAILTGQLSRGVKKATKAGPNGERYIAEGDALRIEGVANGAISAELDGQVDAIRFAVSRTDNIASNQGAVVTGTIHIVALAYIKRFTVTAGFVKSLAAQ